MITSVIDTSIPGKKKLRVLPTGVLNILIRECKKIMFILYMFCMCTSYSMLTSTVPEAAMSRFV